ncbi:MAG TPA: phytanoyl-CoA dioxygenase family protein [Bryobacteraceae bacterium]|nr:phytanoyl-CoA dioxygenase family protein [Bryobacteraceae bacterium]
MALLGSFAEKSVNTFRLPAFRAEHFPYSGPYPWLDLPDAEERIEDKLREGRITEEEARQCRFWVQNGYIVVGNLFEDAILQSVWCAYEDAARTGKIVLLPEKASDDDPYPGRFLNPHRKVGAFCQILKHPGMLHWLRVLTERQPKPLQTIAGHKGSQQGIHSDSIHMTTYPLGYLTAAWIAFEDIHPDSGPLVYYPGSHRLPYVFSKDVGITESEFKKEGYSSYHAKYEPYIKGLIEQHKIEPHYFRAKKGDVLIWHANLLHGGSARRDMQLSRKAVVCHFFVKGSFVYHDLAASRSTQQYVGTCMLRDEEGQPYWRKTAKRPTE